MSTSQGGVIGHCPKCSTPIKAGYAFTWCPKCNKSFPEQMKALILSHKDTQNEAAPISEAAVATGVRPITAPLIISNQAASVMSRYRDAYLVARAVNGYGSVIKAVGMVIGVLLILMGLLLMLQKGQDNFSFAFGVVCFFAGVIVGFLIYLNGILISAQGQILKASLDSAVNSSPFLTNENRARVMSLPEA